MSVQCTEDSIEWVNYKKRSTDGVLRREEVKILKKGGKKWTVMIQEEYLGKQNRNREQTKETLGNKEGILIR